MLKSGQDVNGLIRTLNDREQNEETLQLIKIITYFHSHLLLYSSWMDGRDINIL